MNKLSKAKRDQLILVAMCTVMAIGAVWYFVISAQQEKLKKQGNKLEEVRTKVNRANALINRAAQIGEDLEKRKLEIDTREGAMAPERDTYAWILKTVSSFSATCPGVSIAVSQPEPISDTTLLPNFPYKSCVFHASGLGHYHEIGRFMAEFENSFPFIRVVNLDMAPATGLRRSSGPSAESINGAAVTKDAETLEFLFDIVGLVKPAEAIVTTK